MKIIHCCLSCFYIDNFNYQENILPRQNKADGHDVAILASTETYINNTQIGYVEPKSYFNEDGILVSRIPYRKIPINILKRKIRSYPGVYQYLEAEKPDVIFFHGIPAWELRTIVKYKQDHPQVVLLVDSHEDANNSATNFISRNILHKIFYRWTVKPLIRYVDRFFYISFEVRDFINAIYGIPLEKMEFFPLGGVIFEGEEHQSRRQKTRKALNISDTDILLVHSGKLTKPKRTEDIIQAISQVSSERIRLVIAGSIPENRRELLEPLIEADNRICFVGWKNADELTDLLCAADLYIQPGSQSATMQNAICCGCPVAIYPHKSHEPYLKGNGYYVKTVEDMKQIFENITNNPEQLKTMNKHSWELARELLDYKILAARIYKNN